MPAVDEIFERIGDLRYDLMRLKVDPNNTSVLSSIKSNLNSIFTDVSCEDVIYTDNTDKQFFGLITMPVFSSSQDIIDIVLNNKNFGIKKYKIEFDSKLFNNYTELGIDEILAIVLHEVSSLVINDTPGRRARYLIDSYLTSTNQTIKISNYISYIELLGFGVKEAIRKSASIFYTTMTEPSQFDDAFETSRFLMSGMNKLDSIGDLWTKGMNEAYIVIEWTLRLYKDILTYRIPALHTLQKISACTPSVLIKAEMKNVSDHLCKIDDAFLIQESVKDTDPVKKALWESVLKDEAGIKHYFEDFNMMVAESKTAKSIGEALTVLNKSNSAMSHIDNYLETTEMDNGAKHKLMELYDKYNAIRSSLVESIEERYLQLDI